MSGRIGTEDRSPRSLDAAVDEALRSYPLRPTPAGLAPRVMARLRALPAPPRFRLSWIDYALSLLAMVMGVVALSFWQFVTPESLLRTQERLVVFIQQSGLATPRPELPLALAAIGLAGALLLLGLGVWRSAER
jgi:hypothetical protein